MTKLIRIDEITVDSEPACEYDEMTALDWAEYQFATIEYDYQVHPQAARSIRAIFEQLYKAGAESIDICNRN